MVNDVTMKDAEYVGLTDLVSVISSGSTAAGSPPAQFTKAFRKRFEAADLIISKGQGNYESLDDANKHIFFLFRAKCIVIKKALGVDVGTIMLVQSSRRS